LFDSISIDHDVRWDLPLPSRELTVWYIERVRDAVLELLDRGPLNDELVYFVKLSVFHEDMHTEAFTYTRQTLSYPAPTFDAGSSGTIPTENANDFEGDADLPASVIELGADRDAAFVFDNEKWAHAVQVPRFAIAKTAVTQTEFAAFIEDGGYRRPELWDKDGWNWRATTGAQHPVYWKLDGDIWLRRHFDQWRPLEPRLPVIHVNWYEAEAYCRWAGRRLPTEAEWELAAAGRTAKRHYPWGETPPAAEHANLDWQAMGTVDSAAHTAGDSLCGCRQLIGNVWEWTGSTFNPFPGFLVDPYKDYSRPCFGECKVLRGGCWATRSRLIRNTWRNFYQPDRRDVLAGFRTCAI
jgi:iron(II)-dependent oxidoreductase